MTQENNPVVADWPAESGHYKTVQILVGNSPYLRFGQTSTDMFTKETHGGILKRFLELNQIPFDLEGYYDRVPERKGKGYELVGAGLCDVDTVNRRASFYSYSKGYEIMI